jgi:methionyl-tRNA formyltransferase
MGTPDFAVPTLEALSRTHEVKGVVTQPDRPTGRGRRLSPPPVKHAALRLGLPVYQARTLNTPDALAQLTQWRPDVIVVAACGHILSSNLLELPPWGCVNVHASLLPRWRGAAPVAAAILAGDAVTGVTIMKMDEGIDTGPILAQREDAIRPSDTRVTLTRRLAGLGAQVLLETLPFYLAGDLAPQPQPEEGATYAPVLHKEDGRLEWTRSAVELERKVRAFTPWPGTFTMWQGRRLRILEATAVLARRGEGVPGQVVDLQEGAGVVAGEGVLRLDQLQLAGKRPMDSLTFVRGQRDFVGSRLGTEGDTA